MKKNASLFSYRSASTPIHAIPAEIKLPLMMATTIAIFSVNLYQEAILCLFLIISSAIARISIRVFLANVRILFWYALIILAFRFIGRPLHPAILVPELQETAVYLWRLALVLVAGSLFYETTSTLEIKRALSLFQSIIERIVTKTLAPFTRFTGTLFKFPDVAFLLSLTISFIPRIFATWTLLNNAWDARGGKEVKGIRGAYLRFTVLIPSLLIKMCAVASDTDRAIRNRSA